VVQEASAFKLRHVPHQGSAPAIADVMGGHVDMAGTSLAAALTLLKGRQGACAGRRFTQDRSLTVRSILIASSRD